MSNPWQNQLALPSREAAHNEQVACLLNIAHGLQHYLLVPSRDFDKDRPDLDGGAHASAVTTFMGVCKRLDEILSDGTRWTLAAHNELYAELVKTQKANQEFLAVQKTSAEIVQAPAYQFRPIIVVNGNEFLAIYGDPAVPGAHIVGRGTTPALAVADFNNAFNSIVSAQTLIEPVAPVEQPKRRKKQ